MLAIYARISQDKGENQSSIENQIYFGKEYADKLKLNYKIYQDVGVSGTLPIEQRAELFRLIQDVEKKEITHVFSYDQSRIERDNVVWNSIWLLFQQHNIKLYFHLGGEFNFSSPDTFLSSNVLSVFNSFFVKLTKQKVVNALQKNVEIGRVHASPPYGYTKDSNKLLIVDEKEAEIVKRIYAMSLEGKGTDRIAEALNYEGVQTAYNKLEKGGIYRSKNKYFPHIVTERNKSDAKWRGRTIQGIIKNTIYKGKRFWKGNYYDVPAIFDEVYWQKVNDNLIKNRNNTGKKVEHKYLLKGIIMCSCGKNMYGRSRLNKRDHTYICASKRYKDEKCGNRAINIDKIENLIWEHFFIRKELLKMLNQNSNGDTLLANVKQEKDIVDEKIKRCEDGISNLLRNVVNGTFTDNVVKNMKDELEGEMNKLNSEKRQLDLRIADIQNFESLIVETKVDFEKYSTDVDFDTKRNLIHKYIEKIIVAYDDGRVHKNGHKFPLYTYHIQIEFKNGIVKENYIYNVKSGIIMSFRDRTFKLFTEEGIVETMDSETIDKVTFSLSNGKIYIKPFLEKDNHTLFLDNTIIPYEGVRTWNVDSVVDFYTLNKDWLSKESGINIWIEDKTYDSYLWFVRNYKNYQDKPLIEWVTFLFEALKYNDLLVASKAKTKSKVKE